MKGRGLLCITLLGLITSTSSLLGQSDEDHSPWTVTMYGGASIPALFDLSGSHAPALLGEPRSGPITGVLAEYELQPRLLGTFRFNWSWMEADDRTESELFPPCINCGLGGGTTRTGYSQEQGQWATAQFLAGLELRGTSGRFAFILHVDGGAQWTRSPAVTVEQHGTTWILGNPNYGTYHIGTELSPAETWSLAGGAGVDVSYALAEQFELRLGIGGMTTALGLPTRWKTISDSQRNDGSFPVHYEQRNEQEVQLRTAVYMITLGLTYRFPSWY
jgi:hypothetical protein